MKRPRCCTVEIPNGLSTLMLHPFSEEVLTSVSKKNLAFVCVKRKNITNDTIMNSFISQRMKIRRNNLKDGFFESLEKKKNSLGFLKKISFETNFKIVSF